MFSRAYQSVKNTSLKALHWTTKTTLCTAMGGAIGGSTAIITAAIGGSTTASLKEAVLMSGTGGTVIGASWALLESIGISPTKVMYRASCGEPLAILMFGLVSLFGGQVASAELGHAILKNVMELTVNNVDGYAFLGSCGTLGILFVSYLLIICDENLNNKFFRAADSISNFFRPALEPPQLDERNLEPVQIQPV